MRFECRVPAAAGRRASLSGERRGAHDVQLGGGGWPKGPGPAGLKGLPPGGVPPGLREPSDPEPPPPPPSDPGDPTGPTTPNDPTPAPTTPNDTNNETPGGDPTPTPVGPTAGAPKKATTKSLTFESWRFWWGYKLKCQRSWPRR